MNQRKSLKELSEMDFKETAPEIAFRIQSGQAVYI